MAVQARSVRTIQGGVKVYDYRGTGLVPPVMRSGRPVTIRPLLYVHHIPVIKNTAGVGDLMSLARVLRARGLNVHNADDREGNIFLFTRMDQLCWHAKGANSFSMGTEHMHYRTVGEPWSERQMRAAAYLAFQAWKDHGIPVQMGGMLPGSGVVRVTKRGHTDHEIVSAKAGFHDRSDPGDEFHYKHLFELIHYFDRHRHF